LRDPSGGVAGALAKPVADDTGVSHQKWLRDGLGLISDARETSALAMQVTDSHGVYMVPALVGLGAPHWVPDARALICGRTLATRISKKRSRGNVNMFNTTHKC
jgi:hypothetical protein